MKKIKFAILSLIFSFPLISSAQGWNPSALVSTNLPSESIYYIIQGILWWILAIFGMIAVIGFVISGIMYIVSVGDEDGMKKAKNQMVWSIIGVVVALAGLVIIRAIDYALRGNYFAI